MSLEPRPTAHGGNVRYLHWGPIFAGASAAAALAFVLHAFAAAIGLAASPTAPTWRDASFGLWLLSGLYIIVAALASYGLGGYIAGRIRARWDDAPTTDEIEVRDGGHGLLVWSLATLITAFVALLAAQPLTRFTPPSAGPSGPSTSVGGENIIAYDLDRLFRSADRRPADTDLTYSRSEAARILLTAAGHSGMADEDRAYLVRLVSSRTGLSPTDADKRVGDVVARARDNISRARKSTVLLAFMAGAAALLGAVAAWFAACAGGRHRDAEVAPSLMFMRRNR